MLRENMSLLLSVILCSDLPGITESASAVRGEHESMLSRKGDEKRHGLCSVPNATQSRIGQREAPPKRGLVTRRVLVYYFFLPGAFFAFGFAGALTPAADTMRHTRVLLRPTSP